MTLDPITLALISAIVSLAGACVALYRRAEALHDQLNRDRHRASEIIFALLQERREQRGESAPPTLSEWEDEPVTGVSKLRFEEASVHARKVLNGDWEALVKGYLNNTPSQPYRPDEAPTDPDAYNAPTRRVKTDDIRRAEQAIAKRRKL